MQDIDHFRWALTDEAQSYVRQGSPEVQVLKAIPEDGLPMAELKVSHSFCGCLPN